MPIIPVYSNLAGTSNSSFEIGLTGSLIHANGAALEVKDATNTTLAILRAADPIGPTDVATKEYVDEASRPVPVGLFSSGATTLLPSIAGPVRYILVTGAGSGAAAAYTFGTVLYDNGSGVGNVTILPASVGYTVLTTAPLTGTSQNLATDTIYMWNGSLWIIPAASAAPGVDQTISVPVSFSASGATYVSTTLVPVGAVVSRVQMLETTTYVGTGVTISAAVGAVDVFDATDNNPYATAPQLFIADQRTLIGTAAVVTVTLAGTTITAGAANVDVTWYVPLP